MKRVEIIINCDYYALETIHGFFAEQARADYLVPCSHNYVPFTLATVYPVVNIGGRGRGRGRGFGLSFAN